MDSDDNTGHMRRNQLKEFYCCCFADRNDMHQQIFMKFLLLSEIRSQKEKRPEYIIFGNCHLICQHFNMKKVSVVEY